MRSEIMAVFIGFLSVVCSFMSGVLFGAGGFNRLGAALAAASGLCLYFIWLESRIGRDHALGERKDGITQRYEL